MAALHSELQTADFYRISAALICLLLSRSDASRQAVQLKHKEKKTSRVFPLPRPPGTSCWCRGGPGRGTYRRQREPESQYPCNQNTGLGQQQAASRVSSDLYHQRVLEVVGQPQVFVEQVAEV